MVFIQSFMRARAWISARRAMMKMSMMRLSSSSLSLSLWRARRNGEEIAPRSYSPFSSALAPVVVLLSGDRSDEYTNRLFFVLVCEEERACVVMRKSATLFFIFLFLSTKAPLQTSSFPLSFA